jgi:hypothetical protein
MAAPAAFGAAKSRNRCPSGKEQRSEMPWAGTFRIITLHLGEQLFATAPLSMEAGHGR